MRFAVVTLGSAGDLHPFLAIARALAERGHQVHLLSQAPYETAVRAEGVGFIPIATEQDHLRTLQHPLLWHPLHGFGVLWRHLAVPAIGPTIEALDALSGDTASGPLVVLASPLALGARLARERWPDRIRLASGYTAPMGLRSVESPMFLGAWRVPAWLPARARWALWAGLDRWKLDPMARPALARWCGHLGLPPLAGSAFGDALHAPDGGLALYPAWFAPVPAAWRARRVHQVGFPIFEPGAPSALSAPLEAFLSDPAPYVVAYPGSADQRAQAFASRVTEASRALGVRTLVLSRFARQAGADREGSLQVDAAPLGTVLPGARAFVHHGGIGSIAQGLSANVPQLVLASAYDQFENGARLERLGLGQFQRDPSASPRSVQQGVEALIERRTEEEAFLGLDASRAGQANASVAHATDLLEEMHEQLSLPMLDPEGERFAVDDLAGRSQRLRGYTLLLAIFPPAEAVPQIAEAAGRLVDHHGITGSRTSPERLHVTLHELAQFPAGPDVPRAPIEAALSACDRVNARAMSLAFDRVAAFARSNVFVLQCETASKAAVASLRDTLGIELKRVGLRPRPSREPHMTLVYGTRQVLPEQPIDPIRWTATRLALVLSHVGLTHHQWIKEWALPSR